MYYESEQEIDQLLEELDIDILDIEDIYIPTDEDLDILDIYLLNN